MNLKIEIKMKRALSIVFFLIFFVNIVFAQAQKIYNLSSPLEIPLILSGTFGELRGNHFHTGIDIKTQGKEGLNVLSISDGYISRINVSPWGYGKAIYITHTNGLTSIYAHLQKFAPEIEKLVKKSQYTQKRYNISLYLKKNQLAVKKGQIIAKSGNTGGSGGPHLHFEIRDSKSQKPQNPFNYNYKIKDSRKPIINGVYLYNFNCNTKNNSHPEDVKLYFDKKQKQFFSKELDIPSGYIGFGVNSIDKLNFANNKNGVYSVKLMIDNNLLFEYKMNQLDFAEQRYINSFIDYKYYIDNKKRIQKLYLDPGNKLSVYSNNTNNGFILIEDGKKYKAKIIVEDFEGNKSIANIKIIGTKVEKYKSEKSKIVFDFEKENLFETTNFKLSIPKGALYKNNNFFFGEKNGVYKIGTNDIPLHKSCKISLKINPEKDSLINKMIIAKITKDGDTISVGGKIKGDYISIKTKNLGTFTTVYDNETPIIKPINISEGKWMSKEKYIKIKIKDKLSGIKSYNAYINGEWILFEYDAKKDLIKYDFSDIELKGKKHTFTLSVKDKVDNNTSYEITFFR